MDRTTSAKSTVTCLYSAGSALGVSGEPQASQKRAPGRGWEPHTWHTDAAAITPRP
ncbi:hypothetical protein MSIM_19640 [Mycobacterium simiae]|nr:hypothetical protein MSIM_19640 [Mycobacterium simiae]